MPFSYYARLTRAQQAVYRKSDAITEVRLPRPADLAAARERAGRGARSEETAWPRSARPSG